MDCHATKQGIALSNAFSLLCASMAFANEQREALHLLQSIENGSASSNELTHLADKADSALLYLVFTWLRRQYAGDHPAAEGVIGRLVELSKQPSLDKSIKEGKVDPVVTWFEEDYSYREFNARAFCRIDC